MVEFHGTHFLGIGHFVPNPGDKIKPHTPILPINLKRKSEFQFFNLILCKGPNDELSSPVHHIPNGTAQCIEFVRVLSAVDVKLLQDFAPFTSHGSTFTDNRILGFVQG